MNTPQKISGIFIQAAHIWQLWPAWKTEIPPYRYDFFNLWFVLNGHGTLFSGDEAMELRPGMCALLRPWGDYHATHDPSRPIGYIRIALRFTDADGAFMRPSDSELPPVCQFLSDWHLPDLTLRKVVETFSEAHEAGRPLAQAYLYAFLLHLRHSASHPSKGMEMDRLRPALQAIQEQPHCQFRVEALARLVHLSGNQFTRIFKRATNQTPSQYLIQQRMNRARELLSTSGLSVSETAEMLGYPDVFAFSRQFKIKTGLSPRQWRAQQELKDATTS